MRIAVILPAAGSGRRFAASAALTPELLNTFPAAASTAASEPDPLGLGLEPAPSGPPAPQTAAGLALTKIELDVIGKPAFQHAIDRFADRPEVCGVLLAVAPDRVDEFRERFGDALAFRGVSIVPGGTVDRWETVRLALNHVSEQATHIAVHDAARPAVSERLIDRLFAAAANHPAVIPGLPVAATLKHLAADPGGSLPTVAQTVPRENLVAVQTPQVFAADLLRRAYAALDQREPDDRSVTDDAGLVEALGEPVRVVPGEPGNIKITEAADLELVRALLAARNPHAADDARNTARRRPAFRDED